MKKLAGIDHPAEITAGYNYDRKVYVVLEQGERYWQVAVIYKDKPALKPGQVFVKARAGYYDDQGNLWLQYGIESYYVPEGLGPVLEQSEALDVTVRVDRFGNAVIENVVDSKD